MQNFNFNLILIFYLPTFAVIQCFSLEVLDLLCITMFVLQWEIHSQCKVQIPFLIKCLGQLYFHIQF